MGKFITNFATTAELATASAKTDGSFGRPHVSLTKDDRKVHFFAGPCKSEIVKTTYEWVEIGGIKWATKNVGAKVITDYGQKFSWGGIKGYTNEQVSGTCKSKAFSWADYELCDGGDAASNMAKYNSTDGKTVLEAADDAATVNMGSGWRMPTTAEFQALGSATTSAWTESYEGSGVAGLVLTSTADSSKKLFFPAAGLCDNGSVDNVGSNGFYWSSSLYNDKVSAFYFLFSVDYVFLQPYHRSHGYSVRGVFSE